MELFRTDYPNNQHPEYSTATVYTKDGEIYDYVDGAEGAIHFASQGYTVAVKEGYGHYTREQLQAACDYELGMAVDCFGRDYLK